MPECKDCLFAPTSLKSYERERTTLSHHDYLFVTLLPLDDPAMPQYDILYGLCDEFGIERSQVAVRSLIRCTPESKVKIRKAEKEQFSYCFEHNGLAEDMMECDPKVIVLMGTEVCQVLMDNKLGITKVNGEVHELGEFTAVMSVSLDYVIHSQDPNTAWSMLRVAVSRAYEVVNGKQHVVKREYHTINTIAEFDEFIDLISVRRDVPYTVDYENWPLKPWKEGAVVLSAAVTWKTHESWGFLIDHDDATWTDEEKKHIKEKWAAWCSSNVPKIAANAKHEVIWTREAFGAELACIEGDPIALDYMEDENRAHDVGTMAWRYAPDIAGYEKAMDEYWYGTGKGKAPDYRKAPGDKLLKYNMIDVQVETACYQVHRKNVDSTLQTAHDTILIPAMYTLSTIEKNGWEVDFDRAGKLIDSYDEKIEQSLDNLRTFEVFSRFEEDQGGDFNFDSPPQKAKLFYGWDMRNKRKFEDQKDRYLDMSINSDFMTDAKQPSTDKNWRAAHRFTNDFVAAYDDHVAMFTLRKNFLNPLPDYLDNKDMRIHTDYNASKVASGRLSSTDPNTQNWPHNEEFWSIFVSRFKDGKFIRADYSQVELRVLAWLAMDKPMITTFRNGEDIHINTAKDFMQIREEQWREFTDEEKYEYRQMGKRFNFAVANNRGAHHLALDLQSWQRKAAGGDTSIVVTDEQAQEYLDRWYGPHKAIVNWKKRELAKARETGYVESPFGYRRRQPDITSRIKWKMFAAERKLISFLMQNTAAIITLKAMTAIQGELTRQQARAVLVGSCYDSVYLDAPPDEYDEVARMVHSMMYSIGEEVNTPMPLEVELALGEHGGALVVMPIAA